MNGVHLSGVDLNLLVVLDELLRSRSTTVAARRLGRTQSAVSHALARLRTTLKDPLFVRTGASLRPTTRAEELEVPLRELLAGAESLLRGATASFDPSRLERTFVIGGTDFFEVLILPRLLRVLRREAPSVTLHARLFADEVERALQSREADLVVGTRLRPLAGIVEQPLGENRMQVLVRRGHPVARGKLTLEEYTALDHVVVGPRALPGSVIDEALERLGQRRQVVLRTQHFAAAALIVASSDLVMTVPAAFALVLAKLAPLRALPLPLPSPIFTYAVSFHAAARNDPAQRWLRGHVVAAAREALGQGQGWPADRRRAPGTRRSG